MEQLGIYALQSLEIVANARKIENGMFFYEREIDESEQKSKSLSFDLYAWKLEYVV